MRTSCEGKTVNRAAFAISKDDLSRVMMMPPGWKILHVVADSNRPGGLIFVIEAADGEKIPAEFIRGRYYFDAEGLVTGVNWKPDER